MEQGLITRYLDYIACIRRYSARTCAIYKDSLNRFCLYAFRDKAPDGVLPDIADDELISALSPNMIRSYEAFLLNRGMKARTVNLHISILSGFCRFLIKEGRLPSNPARLAARPKMGKRLPEFYRKEDMDRYFRETEVFASELPDLSRQSYSRRLARAIISTLYNTGIRRAELIGLRRGDIDFHRQVMHVRGKGDKMREIPLIPSFCKEISLYLQSVDTIVNGGYDTGSPLFVTAEGKAIYPTFIDRTVKRELGNTGSITGRKSPHVLRHTVATELLDEGADLNSIKEFLGHSSLAATQVYTHNSIEKLQKVYKSTHPRAKNGGTNGD